MDEETNMSIKINQESLNLELFLIQYVYSVSSMINLTIVLDAKISI